VIDRDMRRSSLPAAAGIAAAGLAAVTHAATPASAAWSTPQRIAGSTGASSPVVAVNGRGDVAAAWLREVEHGSGRTRTAQVAVRAAVRRAGATAFSTRTLLSARERAVQGVAVTIDRRGEATVAWIDQPVSAGTLHGHRTVRAAFRTARGAWSPVQAVGRSSAFFYAHPRLAAAPDGSVVLTYNAGVKAAPGVAAAWRSRGHRFGSVRAVPTDRGYLMAPSLLVDRRGVAHLAGTAGCDRGGSTGRLYTATSRTRRFGRGRTIAPAPAKDVRLSLTGPGTGLVAWRRANCSTTEDLPGAPAAAVLRADAPGATVALGADPATDLTLAGRDVSWAAQPLTSPVALLQTTTVGEDGTAAPATSPPGGWVPVAADALGDAVLRQAPVAGAGAVNAVAARAAGSDRLEPAAVQAAGWPWSAGTAGAPDGGALAVLASVPLSSPAPALEASVWRP
jgi:hypothetical protein